ncbi:hypothetical protein [Herbiconiux sp. VKM Ac-2851]|uniref:hypothetical protein n=1 Tax=Herbiconiux sp. VKM Ac-2851 TaxID=2739025 RepID=UPI001563E30E|nr:hypothetical protein [Herbiconiux sp. VKM Ac-2851]NQX34710.1 hypothetical protein [Herbiconiux sp. VKM Ac-2851]
MSQDASLGPEFSVARARASGVSVGRLRNPGLARPFHGVRARVPPAELEARCRAYAQVMPADAAFSYVTAALLHGLPVPAALLPATTLHVTRPRRALEAAGVSGHQQRLGPSDVVHANGLRVTSPARTLCDLGGSGRLELRDLVAVADAILGAGIRSPFDDDWGRASPVVDARSAMRIRSPFDDDWGRASPADSSPGRRIRSPFDDRGSAAPVAGPVELAGAVATSVDDVGGRDTTSAHRCAVYTSRELIRDSRAARFIRRSDEPLCASELRDVRRTLSCQRGDRSHRCVPSAFSANPRRR